MSEIAHMFIMSLVDMGWLPPVGSLKLQVSFAKEPYKRAGILQKRLIILKSLLIVATPYLCLESPVWEVGLIRRLLPIIRLFCKRAL